MSTTRHSEFYPALSGSGKWHAVSTLAGDNVSVCASGVILDTDVAPIAYEAWTTKMHPICCRRCAAFLERDVSIEVNVWGGHSYAVGVESFPSLLEAARTYVRRMSGYDNGVRFPLWGDMEPTEYAITDDSFGWTVAELEEIVERGAER